MRIGSRRNWHVDWTFGTEMELRRSSERGVAIMVDGVKSVHDIVILELRHQLS